MDGTTITLQCDGTTITLQRFASIIFQCRRARDLNLLKQTHGHIVILGFGYDAVLGNYIVPAYVQCGRMADALHTFDRLSYRNEFSWTSLIQGHVELREFQNALSCFDNMRNDNVCPTNHTFLAITKACTYLRSMDVGRTVHLQIVKEGLESDSFVGGALMDMYARCGYLVEAEKLLDLLPSPDIVSWNILITGYSDYGLGSEALECLSQMQSKGSLPNAVTYVSCLKACISMKLFMKLQNMHCEIMKQGLDEDPFVIAVLVDAYAKHGVFEDANIVLHHISGENNAPWNSLIAGYVEYGFGEEALQCLGQMESEGLLPDNVTYISSLRACSIVGALDKAKEIHAEAIKLGFHAFRSMGNSLINAYVKCGSIIDAESVFDNLSDKCVVSWTTIIAGLVEYGINKDVRSCLEQMQVEGLDLDAATFVIILKALGNLEGLCPFQEIYSMMLKKGFDGNPFLDNTLIDVCIKSGLIVEAQAVFDFMKSPNLVAWNTLIIGYAENGLSKESLECFELMQCEMLPDAATCIAGLKACGIIRDSNKGQSIHSLIMKRGLEVAPFVENSLLDMYVKCGLLVEAWNLFHLLPVHTTVSWNTIIVGLLDNGLIEEASNCIMTMERQNVSLDATSFVCKLQMYTTASHFIEEGQQLHSEMITRGLDGHSFIGGTLVDMYATYGQLSEAKKIFDLLPKKNVVVWTALIAGYAEYGNFLGALECLEKMLSDGISPNMITYICAIGACSETSALNKGQELFSWIIKEGFSCFYVDTDGSQRDLARHEDMRVLVNSLIDMYCKCGSMADAYDLFKMLQLTTTVSWNTLMTGCTRHGECSAVFHLFHVLTSQKVTPDGVVFLNLISVCSHGGLVSIGLRCVESMKKYGICPSAEHFNCMIDLYSRAGQLDEAITTLEMMPFQPDLVTWSTLLGASQNWRNVYLARLSFEFVSRLDEKNAAAFIIMLNLYTDANVWAVANVSLENASDHSCPRKNSEG